jgi:hypothetical protein
MKTIILTAVAMSLVIGTAGFKVYTVGRNHGFNQGWDKGFNRGHEDAEASMMIDDVSGQMYEDSEDERITLSNKSGHPAAFMNGFSFAVKRADQLFTTEINE